MLPTYPSIMSRPFAAGGDKTAIPDTTDAPGRASLAEGFPVLTQTPLTAGGVPPSRLDFNGILNLLSQFAFWQQSGGMHNWSAELDFPAAAQIWHDGTLWISLAPSGPGVAGVGAKQPGAAGSEAHWQGFFTIAADGSGIPGGSVIGGGGEGKLAALLLGTPILWRSTTLGTDMVWANGDAVYLADWPEFADMYRAGGLYGMVLPEGSTAATRAANRGLWTVASNGTALLTPDLRGLFIRGWCPGGAKGAGSWGRDEIRNITAAISHISGYGNMGFSGLSGAFYGTNSLYGAVWDNRYGGNSAVFDASRVVPTGAENVPQHVYQPVAIYMGNHA